jgi:hypothetical protein
MNKPTSNNSEHDYQNMEAYTLRDLMALDVDRRSALTNNLWVAMEADRGNASLKRVNDKAWLASAIIGDGDFFRHFDETHGTNFFKQFLADLQPLFDESTAPIAKYKSILGKYFGLTEEIRKRNANRKFRQEIRNKLMGIPDFEKIFHSLRGSNVEHEKVLESTNLDKLKNDVRVGFDLLRETTDTCAKLEVGVFITLFRVFMREILESMSKEGSDAADKYAFYAAISNMETWANEAENPKKLKAVIAQQLLDDGLSVTDTISMNNMERIFAGHFKSNE